MNRQAITHNRLESIDRMRGIVMVFMLLDHVRETFFLHAQVGDPMDVTTTSIALFLSRTLAHLCAPIFVFLTGLSAYLYMQKVQDAKEVSRFLWKRGLFLILLEITLVNFAWTFQFPPEKIFLQVIWAIGFSMISLAVLLHVSRKTLLFIACVIIVGHNGLDSIHFSKESWMHLPWAVLHDRSWLDLLLVKARTSYPILPWIGVISLGFLAGKWYDKEITQVQRIRSLVFSGSVMLISFVLLRLLNVYGDKPYQTFDHFSLTLMSFFNITKYPPSLLFILLTLGIGAFFLAYLEKYHTQKWLNPLGYFGGAPMFFYLLHLYVLKVCYTVAENFYGKNQGNYYGFDHFGWIWVWSVGLAFALYPITKWFSILKKQRRDLTWLKYF